MEKIFWIINRNKNVVASMSNDATNTMWIDDSSGGQTISLTNGCAIGSYDFKTDAHHEDSVYITVGNFIAFIDKYNKTRLYTIMSVDCDGDDLDVHCEDIGLDLLNEMTNAWNYETEQTCEFYMNQAIGSSSWIVQFDTDGLASQTRALSFTSSTDTCLQRLEDVMSSFGFECDFEITMTRTLVTSMIIHVYEKLQNRTENDISQRFIDGINLVSLNRNESIENLYTAVRVTGGNVDGKTLDISDVAYDDGQYFTTKGDNIIYDKVNAANYSRFSGTTDWDDTSDVKYIYGHYESNTTEIGTLFNEGLADLKEHSRPQLSYEAKVTDIQAELGDYVTVVDQSLPQKVYIRARIQEVVNYYTIDGEDTCTLANYTIIKSNADSILTKLAALEEQVSKVKDSKTYFCLGDNGSYPPSNAVWSEMQPAEIPSGKWMWVKTVTTNSDDTQQIVYTATKSKVEYAPVAQIVSVDDEYCLSDSTTSVGDNPKWETTQPTYSKGKYLWTRKVVTWSDGNVEHAVATYEAWTSENYILLEGLQDQIDGAIQTWFYYGEPTLDNEPASKWNIDDDKIKHLGDLYYDTDTGYCYRFMYDSTTNLYSWSKISDADVVKALEEAKKAQEMANIAVKEVDYEYVQTNSPTIKPTSGWNTEAPTWEEGKYIWYRIKTTAADGNVSYSDPACLTGNTGATGSTGKGIKSITNYYLATASSIGVTTSTSGWTTTVQNVTSSNKYLWNYEVVTYTNNSTSSSSPCIIGAYGNTGATGATGAKGDKGDTGNGIKSIAEYYQVASSNSTAPTSWATTVPTLTTTNKYLWNYETITYTNGSTASTAKRVIGVYGDTGAKGATGSTGATGATGKGVSKIVEQYYLSTSQTSQTGGSWSTSQPEWSPDCYIWARQQITWTNNSVTYTDPILCNAINGANEISNSASEASANANKNAVDAKNLAESANSSATETAKTLDQLTKTGGTLDQLQQLIDYQNSSLTQKQKQIDSLKEQIAKLNESTVTGLNNYLIIDDDGLHIKGYKKNSDGTYTYSPIDTIYAYDGLHINSNGSESSYFINESTKIKNAFIQQGTLANHIVQPFKIDNVQGTGFFWTGGYD